MSSWPPAQVLTDSLLLPWVSSPSSWLPQPAFQEALRSVPAHGNQPPALPQGLGGRRLGFCDENVILAPKYATLPRDPGLLLGPRRSSSSAPSETQAYAYPFLGFF